jgi:hypothetical protein
MTYTSSARQPEPEPRPTWTRGAERPPGGPESSAANESNVVTITAAHTARQGASRHDGRSYVRRAMNKLAELGLAETNGKAGKHPIWNLTPADRGLWPAATSCLPDRRPAPERRR